MPSTWLSSRKSSQASNPSTIASLDPAVRAGDFKRVIELKEQRILTDGENYFLLTNHFVPSPTYQFPPHNCSKQKHFFQHSWLSRFNGLVYSELDEGGYCKYCALFGQSAYSSHTFAGILITRPLTDLQKASNKLREYFEGIGGTETVRKYHLAAVQQAQMFKNVMEHKQIPVDQLLSEVRALTIAKNRQKLKSIVEIVIFCGRQGIALRGHRDDWKHLDNLPHANPRNFIALLRFKVESGNRALEDP